MESKADISRKHTNINTNNTNAEDCSFSSKKSDETPFTSNDSSVTTQHTNEVISCRDYENTLPSSDDNRLSSVEEPTVNVNTPRDNKDNKIEKFRSRFVSNDCSNLPKCLGILHMKS